MSFSLALPGYLELDPAGTRDPRLTVVPPPHLGPLPLHSLLPPAGRNWELSQTTHAGCRRSPSTSTDPGLLFPLLRSSSEAPLSLGISPLSGSSFPGGVGGTRMRRRKMHFFFLISLPHRNLGWAGKRSGLSEWSWWPPRPSTSLSTE